MTRVFMTIDTEYSSGLYTGPGADNRRENFACSIAGITPGGPAGITHKLDLLREAGQKAVFFIDPMPALVWGIAVIEDVDGPILAAGQEVQLHCHTEWLALAGVAGDGPEPVRVHLQGPVRDHRLCARCADRGGGACTDRVSRGPLRRQ